MIAAAFCAGLIIEHIDNEPLVEEMTSTAEDFPKSFDYENHFTDGLLNINAATAEELTELDGIGEKLAERIVAYRDEHGAFLQTEGIMLVPGIGESVYEQIKDNITVE